METKQRKGLLAKLQDLPLATLTIILINVAAFILIRRASSLADVQGYSPIDIYGLKPSQVRIGKLLTSAFVHDSILHLAINMVLLYLFGRAVERVMGKLEFAIFYVGACFAGSIVHVGVTLVATMPAYYGDIPIIGASGAVAGVVGVYAVRFHRKTFRFGGMDLPALFVIMCWFILQLGLAVLGLYRASVLGLELRMVSYWSHLGGFGFGVAVALLSDMALAGEREHLVEQARRNYDEGNLLEATRNYEELLRYDPENAQAHAELGRLWALLEEEDQSLPCYQTAVQLYISKGKEDQALETAEEMKQFWPNAALSHATRFRFASYLEESGDPKRAVQAFREIVEENGSGVEAQMSLLKIGQLQLTSLKDPTAAIGTLRGFLERYPDSEWRRFAEETLARAKEVKNCEL